MTKRPSNPVREPVSGPASIISRRPILSGCLLAVFAGAAMLAYPAFWLTRFMIGEEPTITAFPWSEHNERIAQIPEAERAWPLYPDIESALFTGFHEITSTRPPVEDESDPTPEEAAALAQHERRLAEYLRTHADDLQRIRDTAAMPHLGALIRVTWRGEPIDRENEPATSNILLPEFSTANAMHEMLKAQARIALDTGDIDRVLANAEAIDRIGQQYREIPAVISDLIALRRTTDACDLLIDLVDRHAEHISTTQYARAAALVDAMLADDRNIRVHLELNNLNDSAQRLFTDNGRGSGRFIRGSLEAYENMVVLSGQSMFPESNMILDLQIALSGDRAEFVRIYTEHFDEIMAWQEPPLWERGPLPEPPRANGVSVASIAATLVGSSNRLLDLRQQAIHARCGATRVYIAVAECRSVHGEPPVSLDDLVSSHLDRVPIDPWGGRPLRVWFADGLVTVYSVGPDSDDDGGRQIADIDLAAAADERVWVMLGKSRFAEDGPGGVPDGDLILSTNDPALLTPENPTTDSP